ncbi:4Fe-4S ferredoxin iron-sulfur binding domain protein [Methanothermus fervidus DSM 2088]|uniref:4Fe-4S ferredoxin iron-sulfur binding domain protein n=1 Tax=Methanothermus fervidus (strain ATCC 43054 / DSM 2088 / JCM 10308 / V24 S) TaxID=523846 RepID=E3GYQ4_METFV|nr:4Fe-4S binding protein [Methanothermus fervidus]ADP77436.1 4Fe-4S ferredoxin iron-sulfur binding domain protein [Methanothermus fervidus DSM 2088]
MSKITIDYDKCDGPDCAECVDVCPMEILVIEGDKVVAKNTEECNECMVCMDVCPNEAITVEPEE